MKKLLTALLAAMLCLTGCGGGDEVTYDTTVFKDFFIKTNGEMTTWNYLDQASSANTKVLTNIVSGLVETDKYGRITADLAETWTHNDDYSVWTFTLREGQMWQKAKVADGEGNYTYEEYGEITAQDFVDAMQWVLTKENGSVCYEMAISNIKNAEEYFDGEITDFSQVGVKALDKYTVEYTCVKGTPYFDTELLYPSFYPAPGAFIEECGESFGSAPEYILYSGAYLVSNYQNDTEKTLIANEAYWDYESITIPTVKMIAVKDTESTKEYFERGELSYCQLAGTQPVAESNNGNEYMYRTDSYACDYTLFLNNQYADENGRAAINNLNFRKALYYGFDRYEYVAQAVDPIDPTSLYAYTYTPADWGIVTSDGTDYTDLPALANYNSDPYDSDLAHEYLDKAVAELEGKVTWPVSLNWYYKSGNETNANVAAVLKDVIETEFEGYIEINVCEYTSSATTEVYTPELNALAVAGWIPDYGDPCNVLYTILPDGYMNNVTEATMSGWDLPEFVELYEKADAIADDVDARYNAFAEAEAYLLDNCYIIPVCQAGSTYRMSTFNEYSKIYSKTGGVNYRYKGMEVYDHVLTSEEHAEMKAAWQAERVELGLAAE